MGNKWKEYENTQKGFSKFAKASNLTVYGEQPYAKEDLPEELALRIYSSERRPGDFDCYEMGDYVYVMRFEDFSGSYFKTVLKKQCLEHEYQNHLTELLKKYKIKI